MELFETLLFIALLASLFYSGYQYFETHFMTCPKCDSTMNRVRREHPKEPYYLDYAFRCKGCGHEVEGGHENRAESDD